MGDMVRPNISAIAAVTKRCRARVMCPPLVVIIVDGEAPVWASLRFSGPEVAHALPRLFMANSSIGYCQPSANAPTYTGGLPIRHVLYNLAQGSADRCEVVQTMEIYFEN